MKGLKAYGSAAPEVARYPEFILAWHVFSQVSYEHKLALKWGVAPIHLSENGVKVWLQSKFKI